jgi:myo-inositol-1-phosphate synthase
MTYSKDSKPQSLLLMIAGAKGAVASTVATAVAAMGKDSDAVLPSLTTRNSFSYLGPPHAVHMTGWDTEPGKLTECINNYGVLPEPLWKPYQAELDEMTLFEAPSADLGLKGQVEHLILDIRTLRQQYADAQPILIDLLPACVRNNLENIASLDRLYAEADPGSHPDLAYVLAAIFSGVPVINFSPNSMKIPVVLQEAIKHEVPISGCDGKTGQTYFKVVLASALKARHLFVDGWYSLNILGNADGKNLMDPHRAAGKVANKTELLDDILGYPVGERYGEPSHKVHIDYYPPRGDAKEAWDAIDFQGMFGLPMSIRLNFQARDSILAAPLVLDLARMAALKMAGRTGPIPELGFYFKKPLGENPPLTFQDQIESLKKLEKECDEKVLRKRL